MFALRRVSRVAIASVALVTLLALAGAALGGQAGPPPAEAVAMLVDTGANIVGRVAFATTAGGKTEVRVSASGLTPGFHGFHVHAVGDCSAADFTSAGGHYNPAGTSHPNHAGDMPVLLVNADGKGSARIRTDRFAVDDLFDADGSAVIVHANPDNYANIPTDRYDPDPDTTTLATGDAGSRVACGVVERPA